MSTSKRLIIEYGNQAAMSRLMNQFVDLLGERLRSLQYQISLYQLELRSGISVREVFFHNGFGISLVANLALWV